MWKAPQSPVDSGILLTRLAAYPAYAAPRSTFAQAVHHGGLPLLLGCFTGWVHSNSPHKTLYEPGCFYISLCCVSPTFKRSFSTSMAIQGSSCAGLVTSVVLSQEHAATVPTSEQSPCLWPPCRSSRMSPVFALTSWSSQAGLICASAFIFGKPVKSAPAWSCCWLHPGQPPRLRAAGDCHGKQKTCFVVAFSNRQKNLFSF